MAVEGLSREEKERILKALEVDREFRYALMGLLGFSEILERITKLEEHFARLEERQQKLEEQFARLEERFAKLEERYQRLEEKFLELRKAQQRLEERFQKMEERVTRLEERMVKVEETLGLLWREVKELKKAVGALGRRLGRRFESLVREVYRDLLVEHGIEPARVERLRYVDVDGRYLAPGSPIEVDIYVHNRQTWIIEVKSLAEPDDVQWFHTKARIVEEITGRRADRKLLLAVEATKEAKEEAERLGVELLAGEIIEE